MESIKIIVLFSETLRYKALSHAAHFLRGDKQSGLLSPNPASSWILNYQVSPSAGTIDVYIVSFSRVLKVFPVN